MEVTVYTINCPQCNVLEVKLKKNNIEYQTVYGVDEITKRGYRSAPILEVDGKTMTYAEALKWLKGMEAGDGDAG